jgi:hypothetical protein
MREHYRAGGRLALMRIKSFVSTLGKVPPIRVAAQAGITDVAGKPQPSSERINARR